ncbi:unnamed protein product [Polarella glacialis]|uniref:peptidylprolyl isomerase n=1 Tax=Polarella glacialis TaxID=89957 RepID=A0A813FN89_POLGL|nr:unnamed protein product [Polarella glacialis]
MSAWLLSAGRSRRQSLLHAGSTFGRRPQVRSPRLFAAAADEGCRPRTWWWTGGAGDASEDEMMVYIPIGDDVIAADIVADIQRSHLTLGIRGQPPVIDGELWKDIKAHDSEWVIDNEAGQRCLIVTLIKRDVWIDYDYLLKSHACADVEITHKCFLKISVDGESGSQSIGRLVVGLYGRTVPRTVENFRALCTGERGQGLLGKPLHYKGTVFTRVLPGILCQAGDVTHGDGTGGESIYGPVFDDEGFSVKHSKPGLLSMANRGPNTNASQFFITLDEAPDLDGRHVVFGEVLEGHEFLPVLGSCGDSQYSGSVERTVLIEDCGQLPESGVS